MSPTERAAVEQMLEIQRIIERSTKARAEEIKAFNETGEPDTFAPYRSAADAGCPEPKGLGQMALPPKNPPTQEPEIGAAFSRLIGHIDSLKGAIGTLEKRLDPLCAPPFPKELTEAQNKPRESAMGALITEQANKVAALCEAIRDLDLRLRI